jgi:probable HAF family extracellular repeat protein
MTNLTALTGMAGCARAINDGGEVVGMGELNGNENGIDHAYNFTTKTDLGTLGGQNSDAYAINASGQVVGYADTASGGWHPFVYSNGHMTDLGSFDSAWPNGVAEGINTAGQIVGYMASATTYHAFLYSDGQMTDLNSLISPTAGWTLEEATSINDAGQIVGYGVNPSGQVESYLLTPVPEPHSAALLAAAAVTLLVWRFFCPRARRVARFR